MQFSRLAALAGCCAALAGCDTTGGRGESTTYLHTEPSALCELRGQNFARTVKTPNSVRLPHAAAPIAVSCKSQGYADAAATLDTAMDTSLLGAFLFSGMFGMGNDSTRGVGNAYPPRVMLALVPLSFATAAERDAWFDRHKAELDARWADALAETRNNATCKDPIRAVPCQTELRKVEQARDGAIKELEARRDKATVTGS